MSETNAVNVRTAAEIAGGEGLATEAKVNRNEAAIASLVELAESTLSPKDMLKKYAALGGAFIKHARWQKSQFKAWDKSDYERLAGKIEDEVKFRLPIKDVRMDTYARVHIFVECVRPVAPEVDKVSYFQIANKFLPMLQWDKVDLEGSIKAEWVKFVVETIKRQASDDRLSVKDLDAAIEERKAEIKRESDSRRDPVKALEAEKRAENAKIVAKRQSGISAISKAIGTAIGDGMLSGKDIADTIASVAVAHNVELPGREVLVPTGFDPVTCNVEQVKLMMTVLLMNGKVDEIRTIAEISARMVASLDAGTVKPVAKVA